MPTELQVVPIELEVIEVEDIATDVRALTLATPDGARFPTWGPGAHLDLVLGSLRRQYSITDGVDDHCRIAVLREANSRGGSVYVHQNIAVGQRLPLAGLGNNFVFAPSPSARGVTFVAGGIGITPILPMARAALAHGLEVDVHYGARTRDHMAFRSELTALASHAGVSVSLTTDDEDGPIAVASAINARPASDPVYCCGPAGLIGAVRAAGAARGRTVHFELFRADSTEESGESFTVAIGVDGPTISVPADVSLLDALRDNGFDVPSSCEEGTCGTCELRVIDGRVDHRDHVLGDSERAAGDAIMPCVSRAHGLLTIDI